MGSLPQPDEGAISIKVEVTPAARDMVASFRSRYGVLQKEVVARALVWLGAQDEAVQKAVIFGGDPGAELVKLKSAEMAASGELNQFRAGLGLGEAFNVAKAALEQAQGLALAYEKQLQAERQAKKKK